MRVANTNLNYMATGTFCGTVIGVVANGAHETNGAVAIYTAVGPYSFNVSIGSSSVSVTGGSMTIDGASLTFSGSGAIIGTTPTEYTATMSGSRSGSSLSGSIRGAFLGNPADSSSVPRNSAGSFNAHNSGVTYQISGVHFSQVSP